MLGRRARLVLLVLFLLTGPVGGVVGGLAAYADRPALLEALGLGLFLVPVTWMAVVTVSRVVWVGLTELLPNAVSTAEEWLDNGAEVDKQRLLRTRDRERVAGALSASSIGGEVSPPREEAPSAEG